MTKSRLGEKIKRMRILRGLTQSELAADKITRNMLSSIENGAANPSLETLRYLAERLETQLAYLLSEDDDLIFYEKKAVISKIYRAYEAKNFNACISLIEALSDSDDELNYLLASSYLELGKRDVANGALLSAENHLKKAKEHAEKTRINAHSIKAQIPMYLSVSKNIQSPLLEFDAPRYENSLVDAVDFEFFKYLTLDLSYSYQTPALASHIEAKILIKQRNYTEAAKRLIDAAEGLKNEGYNAFCIFGIYSDLEYCYKQLYDFEKAYFYSSKKLTLLESFKT